MIITLKGADFSASNIGTLSSWTISRVLGDGATYNGVTYVDKDAALNATVTIADGYELGSAGVTVTMGGSPVTSGITTTGNTITISITSVTGNVVIKVPTKNTNTGVEDGGNDDTPSEILISTTGAVLKAGYALSETESIPSERAGYYTYEYIPVKSNTTYELKPGRRIWEFDAEKTPLFTDALHKLNPIYQWTTGNNTAYVSVTVADSDKVTAEDLILKTIG